LRFEPHSDVKNLFPKDLADDDATKFVDQLSTVPADSVLYKVYAMDQPDKAGGVEKLIGSLVLDGNLTKSKWADESLFFRH
jgi:hypothetical protein